MNMLELTTISKQYPGGVQAVDQGQPDAERGGAGRAGRTFRLRENNDAADDRGFGKAGSGNNPDPGAGG